MTAKEALREKIDDLTEHEAERILLQVEAEMAARPQPGVPGGRTLVDLVHEIRAIFAEIPEEEWAKLPPPTEIDKHLNADLAKWFTEPREQA